jgi:hypothetical protein
MLTVSKGIISTPTQKPLIALFKDDYIKDSAPQPPNYLDLIEEKAGGLIERFGKGVGEGASENIENKKFNIDLNVEDFIVPIVSGIILYWLIKG